MITLAILPFSIIGFLVSFYIFYKKHKKKEKMVCMVGKDCDRVIHSEYSTIFGIHLEFLGMLYYLAFSALVLVWNFGIISLFSVPLFELLIVASTGAFVFSLYLIYIQAFIIKDWCEYCLVSAAMSAIIFFIEIL